MNGVESGLLNRTLSLSSILRAKYSNQRIALPVNRREYLYANFKHISGVPSEGSGYSLSKLRILDILIERLNMTKAGKNPDFKSSNLSPAEVDELLSNLQSQLHDAVSRSKIPYGGVFAEPGLYYSVLA